MSARAKLLSGLLASSSLSWSSSALAWAPAQPVTQPAPEKTQAEPTVEQALASGDLTTARELATAAREDEPNPANWLVEAQVYDALGDYAGARDSYRGYLDAVGDQAPEQRAQVEARLEAIEEASRGAVADEPASTHREQIDAERAERLAATQLKPPPPAPVEAPPDRIVKKWYFWVTLAAIAGAAGAIIGISAKAANQERQDALGRAPGPTNAPSGGVVFRF